MMHRYLVIFIVVGLLIEGIGAPNLLKFRKKKSVQPMVDIIDDFNVDPIENLDGINDDNTSAFYTQEENLFYTVECLYRMGEHASTSSLEDIGRPNCHKDILALAHITILAFWTAVNFRIGTLLFSIFEDHNKVEYQPLKAMCSSLFTEMCFTFREFREQLKQSMNVETGKCLVEGKGNINAIKQVMTTSLDLVSDKDTLSEQEPDKYSSEIIDWNNVPDVDINGKLYKTMFPTVINVQEYYKEIKDIDNMYNSLYNQVTEKMNSDSTWHIRFNLTKQIVNNVSSTDFTKLWDVFNEVKYTTSLQMWHLLLKDQSAVDSKTARVHRIRKMIGIMKKIRLVHYTIINKSLNTSDNLNIPEVI